MMIGNLQSDVELLNSKRSTLELPRAFLFIQNFDFIF